MSTPSGEDEDESTQRPVVEPSARYEVGRPARPPVVPARIPPKLRPPKPPPVLKWSGSAWRWAALALGLAVGLVFFDILGRKAELRALVAERAGDLGTSDINLATNIVVFGSLGLWALLAVLALFVSRGMTTASFRPRIAGVVLAVAVLGVLSLTAFPLTGSSGLALAARIALVLAALVTVGAAALGLAPGTWTWVRENRDRRAPRPATAGRPEPPPPPPGH